MGPTNLILVLSLTELIFTLHWQGHQRNQGPVSPRPFDPSGPRRSAVPEFRRLRGDLIETYKILKGLDKLDAGRLFPMLGESRTRGHSLRIRGNSFRTEMRKTFFTQRVVSLWNSLPQKVVEASSLAIFKRALDVALVAKGIRGYGEKAGTGY